MISRTQIKQSGNFVDILTHSTEAQVSMVDYHDHFVLMANDSKNPFGRSTIKIRMTVEEVEALRKYLNKMFDDRKVNND